MSRSSSRRIPFATTFLICLLVAAEERAIAQRANENAVREAEDAFGFSVGGETVGLYTIDSVRGFSPSAAGNIRMEGLYVDRQGYFSSRIVRSSTVRVGVNTLGYLFPAPSGIADFSLRAPSDGVSASVTAGLGEFASPFLDIDAGLRSADGRLGITAGISLHPDENMFRDNDTRFFNAGVVSRWEPSEKISILGYLDREQGRGSEISPTYYTAGPWLPPRIERRRFLGQDWARYSFNGANEGLIARFGFGEGWTLRAGAFHSLFNPLSNAFDLVHDVRPNGAAQRTVILLPEQRFESVSGDIQLERRWTSGRARHTLVGQLRGRDYRGRFGGEAAIPLGVYEVNDPAALPAADPIFGPQNRDRVQQLTAGLSYRLEWAQTLDIGLGLQRADYRKTLTPGAGAVQSGRSSPWLYNASAAWRISPRTIAYASYARGLEESGTAPGNAVNIGEVLPAIETTQAEVGLRLGLGPMTLTTAAFDIRRPYAALDSQNVFRFVGAVRHRGIEASLAGSPVEGLFILGGLLILDPRITGEEVDAGLRGDRPIGQTPLTFQGSLDYQLPFLPGASVDLSLNATGPRTSRRDNLVDLPARAIVGIGGRYRFRIDGRPMTLRASVNNLFDQYGLTVSGVGAYDYFAERRWRLTLTTDL